ASVVQLGVSCQGTGELQTDQGAVCTTTPSFVDIPVTITVASSAEVNEAHPPKFCCTPVNLISVTIGSLQSANVYCGFTVQGSQFCAQSAMDIAPTLQASLSDNYDSQAEGQLTQALSDAITNQLCLQAQ